MKITYNEPEIFRNVISPSVFTWDDVDWCLNSLPFLMNADHPEFNTHFELINYETGKKNDPPIPLCDYEWPKSTFDVSYVHDRINQGDTIVISNLSRYNKDINVICKHLEVLAGFSADAHLYCSLHSYSKSFGIHNDIPHNVAVQFDGTCLWKVWRDKVLVIDDELQPGDAIYIPANYYHKVIPTGRRISISFPFGLPSDYKPPDRNWYTLK
jgi:hypothetical protein